jgi:molecular chaperone GrpE
MKKSQKEILDQKIKELEEGWKRTQADFENFRKRTEEQRGEILNLMKADFLAKITPVLDNFRRAFAHAPARHASQLAGVAGRPDDEFARGLKQIEKQLEDILTAEGLEKIAAEPGGKFDCNLHEAISCEPNKKIPDDHIIAETESGWMFKDKVIKPSKVRVSKGK